MLVYINPEYVKTQGEKLGWDLSLKTLAKETEKLMPTYGSPEAAGMDLRSAVDLVLAPGERALVATGLHIELPKNMYGRIAPRSGLAVKAGIDVLAGVVDSDYRGEVKVVLINLGKEDFQIKYGDRIAQLIVEPYTRVRLTQTVKLSDLESTERGSGGMGSTGV